jgi:NADH dehydrogenase
MPKPTICILGGTGFVGTQLASRLIHEGYPVKILTRRREANRHLLILPDIQLIETDIHQQGSLTQQLAGVDVVINLVGILNESGNKGEGFRLAHVELARKVIQACEHNGVKRLLHMSALNADASKGPSHYLRTKGEAEELVHKAASRDFQVTSFRPSVIFGTNDDFFNRFAKLLKLSPIVFPLACPESRFAPVYINDVVDAFMHALVNKETAGQRYDLCGPHQYSLIELVSYTAQLLRLECSIIGMNNFFSRIQARVLEWVPGKPFSRDNYLSLQVESICANNDFERLGITPQSIEAIIPGYLVCQDTRTCYFDYRMSARRNKPFHK